MKNTDNITVHPIAAMRHFQGDPKFSGFLGSEEELCALVRASLQNDLWEETMRDGVYGIVVKVHDPENRFRAREGKPAVGMTRVYLHQKVEGLLKIVGHTIVAVKARSAKRRSRNHLYWLLNRPRKQVPPVATAEVW